MKLKGYRAATSLRYSYVKTAAQTSTNKGNW